MAITMKSSAGHTVLAPQHLPSPAHTGVAMCASESAYPEMWDQHVYSFTPCFYPAGRIMPGIGISPPVRYTTLKQNRQWAIQDSILENHFEMSPIGPGFYTGPGANLQIRNGYQHLVPWRFQDGDDDAPHTYITCVMMPEQVETETYELLYADNPRLNGFAKFRGELVAFNSESMACHAWAGGNTSNDRDIGTNRIFTQDNFFTEGQWHVAGIRVGDLAAADVLFCRDGLMHTPPATILQDGTYTGKPVYFLPGQVRMFEEFDHTDNEIACSLFQIFNRGMSEWELEDRTADPLKMFWPIWLRDEMGAIADAAAATKEVFLGRLAGMSETVLAGTSQ